MRKSFKKPLSARTKYPKNPMKNQELITNIIKSASDIRLRVEQYPWCEIYNKSITVKYSIGTPRTNTLYYEDDEKRIDQLIKESFGKKLESKE